MTRRTAAVEAAYERLRPELIKSPHVQAALALLQRLLAGGVRLPSSLVRRHAEVAHIPEPALRRAKGYLRVQVEPRFKHGPSGKNVFSEWVWSLPPAAQRRVAVEAPPPAANPEPPTNMNPAARAECFRLRGQWTHPLGDDEYRRLCAGGAPLPTPSQEPWLPRRRR